MQVESVSLTLKRATEGILGLSTFHVNHDSTAGNSTSQEETACLKEVNEIIPKLHSSSGCIEFYRDGSRVRRRFIDVLDDVSKCAFCLGENGIQKGTRVGFVGSNCYELVVADLACLWLGAIAVPLDPSVKYVLDDVIEDFNIFCVLSDVPAYLSDHDLVLPFGFWRDVLSEGKVPIIERYNLSDPFSIKFTSGSTGSPKALEASAQSVSHRIGAIQGLFQHGPGDRILVFLPLYLLQQRYWIYSAILFNFDLILVPPKLALYALTDSHPTVVMGVPAFYESLYSQFLTKMTQNKLQRWAFKSYKIINRLTFGAAKKVGFPPLKIAMGGQIKYLWTGSAAATNTTLKFFNEMGIPLLQGYGMNETCIVSKNSLKANKIGSAGKLLPGITVYFEEDGEILINSNAPVTHRYLRCLPHENEAIFRNDNFVASGDLGYLDKNGFLWITGRKKEIIVLSSGRKIDPSKVEGLLKRSAYIENCMAYGNERAFIVAIIQPAKGANHSNISDSVLVANRELAPEERVVRYIAVPGAFSIENGLLTSQHKLRRDRILGTFREEIEKLYTVL